MTSKPPVQSERGLRKLNKRLERQLKLVSNHHAVILDLIEQLQTNTANAVLTSDHPAPYSAIETIRVDKPTGTSVAFSSLGNETGLIRAEYKGVLSETGDNIVFVKDFQRLWFQKELHPHTKTRHETCLALEDALQGFERPWRFVGSSAGGFAALYFGALLNADHIFAFAPQSNITPRAFSRFRYQTPEDTDFDMEDPENNLTWMFEIVKIKGQAHVYYGDKNKMDSDQALNLSETKNVTLHALPERTHHVAYHLRKSGKLLDAISPQTH